jgi:hypothetical protein
MHDTFERSIALMKTNMPFFTDSQAYTTWSHSMPAIMAVLEGGADELAEEVEGPYFYDQHHLILRVNGTYCALVRVDRREVANFFWWCQAETQDDGGDESTPSCGQVFAAYCWNRRDKPPVVIGGQTIVQAREALSTYLSHSGTIRLLPQV